MPGRELEFESHATPGIFRSPRNSTAHAHAAAGGVAAGDDDERAADQGLWGRPAAGAGAADCQIVSQRRRDLEEELEGERGRSVRRLYSHSIELQHLGCALPVLFLET